MKKLILMFFVLVSFGLSFNLVKAESQKNYEIIYSENLERVQSDFFQETALWANNGELISGIDTINGEKSLKFSSSDSQDSWTVFGGTTLNDLLLTDGNFQTGFKFHTSGLSKLVVKVIDFNTDNLVKQINIDLVNNQIIDNEESPLITNEISLNKEGDVFDLSFFFMAEYYEDCYLVFSGFTTENSSELIMDDFVVYKQFEVLQYRTIEQSNFDNSEGEIHTSSVFFLNDSEGTEAGFIDDEAAINNKSLYYQINKVGWDILGGSQGDKINMKGGHHYKISLDIKLIDVDYLSIKVITISVPETVIYDMHINKNGQRIPGVTQIQSQELVEVNGDVTHVEFTLDSNIEHNSYIVLHAKSNSLEGKVVLDNFIIQEEIVELPYISFDNYFQESFDEVDNYSFDELVLGNDVSGSIETGKIFNNSLLLETNQVFKWVDFIKTNTEKIEIKNDKYKTFLSLSVENIGQVKIELIEKSSDRVIHEYYFDPEKAQRIEGVGIEYRDYGKLVMKNGVFDIQFEFPSLITDEEYYLNISGYSLSNNSSISLDNFTILKARENTNHSEDIADYPDNDNEASDLHRPIGGTDFETSALPNNITTFAIIGGVIIFGVIGIIVLVKFVSTKKMLIILVGGILTLGISGVIGATNISFTRQYENAMSNEQAYENYNTVFPQKISGQLNNPGMGWVSLEEPTYGGHPNLGTSGLIPEVDNISLSTSWALIETKEGIYDFTLLDKVIDFYTEYGKHINLRITTDNQMLPNTYKAVPNWLLDKYHIPYEMLDYTDGGPVQTMKVVDITDPNYLHHLGLFLEALSEHYKDNKFVDVVEIRGYGNWGEWHSGYRYDTDLQRMSALQNVIDEYEQAFTKYGKLIVLSAAWDPYYMPYDSYQQYIEVSAFDYLFKETSGTFRRDSGANLLNYYTDERLLSDAFRSGKRVPLLGEYASTIDANLSEQYGFDLEAGIDDILFKMRPNYSTVLGWVNHNVEWLVSNGYEELFDRGNEKLGYRLAVDMARYPKTVDTSNDFTLMTSFSNSAVGRFWFEDKLKISFLDQNNNEIYSYINTDFDARTFVLGEVNYVYSKIDLPESMPNGEYKVCVSIVDELGNPHIKLGMGGEIDDSKTYYLGDISVSNKGVKDSLSNEMSYDEARNFKFEKNQTYAITFDYTPYFDISMYEFGTNDGYIAALTTEKGGSSHTVGYNKWQDVSGENGQKTIIFTTGNYDDYKFVIDSDKYGDIDINSVYIEKMNSYYEHFENYDFSKLDSLYLPASMKNAYLSNQNEAIGGNTSVIIDSSYDGDFNALYTDSNVMSLLPNTTYTISFNYKNLGLVGKGGYMYVNLVEDDLESRIGEFYERSDTDVTTKTFSFTTNDSQDIAIAFGMHNGGKYAIDDIQIIRHTKGTNVTGENIENEHNIKPNHIFSTFGDIEGFESNSFIDNAFDWGYFGWGQFTYDPEYVISGNASLMGNIEAEAEHNEWFEFAKTKSDAYPFEANKTYRIQFDYKIIENPGNDGRFYFLLRSSSAGIAHDKGFTTLPVVESNNYNKVYSMDVTITTGNYNDYCLIFGMHWLGIVVIDNVVITEVS